MQVTPNTAVTIREPVNVDTFSGKPASWTVVASGVPAYWIERPATRPRTGAEGRAVETPATTTPRLLRVISVRLPHGTPISRTAQVTDERYGRVCAVNSVRGHDNLDPQADVICELTAVDTVDP